MFALHANAQQQGQLKFDLNYSYAIPLGSFKSDLISNASPRGANGAIMYGISNKWSAGLHVGYQDFYQKYPRDIYQTGSHEVTSAVLTNSIQTIPILAKATFSPLGSKAPVQPYLSVGAGLGLINYDQYLGEFGSTDNSASFAAQGGLGVKVPFGKYSAAGFKVGANYNYMQYKKFGYSNLNNVSLQAGVYFPL